MAALLGVFHSVPPVIRKRAKELLEAIRDAVKQHLSTTSSAPATGKAPVADVSAIADDDSVSPHAIPQNESSSLWTGSATSINMVASSSSQLFSSTRSTVPRMSQTMHFSASASSLFGKVSPSIFPSKTVSNKDNSVSPHFREVVARINSTLVIAPSVPKIPEHGTRPVDEDVNMESSVAEVSGMQVEIPFVPATQRKTIQTVEDSIVVVGQARQKKRKRTKTAPVDETASVSAETSSQKTSHEPAGSNDAPEPRDHEPFDFSAVPNILDDNPNAEDNKQKKRQKKQKSAGVFYGDFPAPPKAHSELKRGNQSHTFK
ncbi:hypothetical protein H0H81_001773 [Sphagnurus paluster]|uniref:Uncharacterized protein n=1 Tax=Sphagnurus paluster TaxID=117069 RepID=A0A9P7GJU6_9AGAR|nr:hypothetical protein H0H81_001773 [Sphagnurus paluster]